MIQRDGNLISLWQETVQPYLQTAHNTQIIYDVIIAGGGITGITLAMELQKKGLTCIVLEANTLCFGTTGGTTAHLNTLLDTPYSTIIKNFGEENAKLVAVAAKDAINLIKSNIKEYNIDCGFEETASYLFAQDEQQEKELADIEASCKVVEVDCDYTGSIPISIAFTKALEVLAQGKISPCEYVYALADAFENAGGSIVQHARVAKHTIRKDAAANTKIVEVSTEPGELYMGKALVYATHIPPGVNLLHMRCAPYRSYAMAVKLKGDHYPDGLVYDMYEPYHYYRTQEIKGEKYFIAGGEDHKTAHEANTEKCFLQLESHIKKHFNVAEVTHKWSSQYFEPTDGLPYIGHLPGAEDNVFVATGYGGNGIIYSHVAAMHLSTLITAGEGSYGKLFNPGRVKPIAGFSNFVKENADVAKQLITKWFGAEELASLSGIAIGEGKVVELDGRKIALYKDENSNLHGVDPICTHMKCTIAWNSAERTWDCPCHGGRFSIEGEVLTGPADRDLEKIALQ